MKKIIQPFEKLLILLIIACPINIHAQNNWSALGSGLDGTARCIFEDTLDHKLYIGGSFKTANGDTVSGIAHWNGQEFNALGNGMRFSLEGFSQQAPPTTAIIRYDNKIFATGFFPIADFNIVNGIAVWDGVNWQPIGSGLSSYLGSMGVGYGFHINNNELYLCGGFDSINGIEAHGLAKFDGLNWSAVHDFPLVDNESNMVDAVAFYKDELYVGGNLDNASLGVNSLMKWDGANWVAIPGIYGGMAAIIKMCVYKDELYVAGTFSKSDNPNNPGNYIAKWNGLSWSDVGGGVLGLNGSNGQIYDMIIHDNKLYVAGVFSSAGGIPSQYISVWDGNFWCGSGSTFNNIITSVGFLNDTLYVGGGFTAIDGDSSCFYIAKWNGGNYIDTCGNNTFVDKNFGFSKTIHVYPNPMCESSTVELPTEINNGTLLMYDQYGREVMRLHNLYEKNIVVSRNNLQSGMYYFIVVEGVNQVGHGSFAIE